MKQSRLRARIGATAAAAVVLTGGAVALAAPASAKANLIAIDGVEYVAKPKPVITVDVTYSCDTGETLRIEGVATSTVNKKAVATGTLASGKVTCDFGSHIAEVKLTPKAGTVFHKGDKVKVAVKTLDATNVVYADAEKFTKI
ncbi:hypothetical protein SSP35_49_00010 [Streptomyces sp. NBRC 110611]|uniref:hypothetical protein n=1 Tax=Streptomyces sp. NBRC 110611 TaxID=1621259 RepID=UPI00082BAF1A|nr:hypothetical protein [Streptomyces sp. NBRC 110611]GAU71556.1 hypothetical protein SSP35_49_00010 [Streptomyces sp. NBRC 110611]